jgi:WD40 repeat protein
MQKSPYKFLDSYSKEDRDIFFGRDKEIEELHSRVFESRILIVYGTSGTGKSSLINCGLANKFNDSDWLPVTIRRGLNVNQSLFDCLDRIGITNLLSGEKEIKGNKNKDIVKIIRSIYLDHFKPVYLIFDQFEELFIFGNNQEKDELISSIKKVIDSDLQCRFIFSIREEYLAGATEFEKIIPSFLTNRIRIEKMTRQNAIHVIEGPCHLNKIDVEPGFSVMLLEKLNPDNPDVELTWLQVYLDKIFCMASQDGEVVISFTEDLLGRVGEVKDLLGSFLEEQISQLDDPELSLVILKSFVSVKGTKHQITEEEVIEYTKTLGKDIDRETVKGLIQKFISLRILRDKDENSRYELRHDSLAAKIYEKITLVEKELLEIRQFLENAFNSYEKRQIYLNAEDLDYIAPYEEKLFLSEKAEKFIAESKKLLHKSRRRRQNILVSAAAIIIVVLSFFSVWAFRERGNALGQKREADSQRISSLRAKNIADSASMAAMASRNLAMEKERLAVEAQKQSEEARKEAIAERENALQQKRIAERLSVTAREQADIATEEKLRAETEKGKAVAAESEARKLAMLSRAQNIALKSMNMMEWTAGLNGLLAVQAFNLNRDNGGSINDPVIFEALYKSWTVLDKYKHQLFRNSPNEIRAFTDAGGLLLTADLDGAVRIWKSDGSNTIDQKMSINGPVDFIKFSPSGKYLIYGRENSSVYLKELLSNEKTEFLLIDKAALIMSAAFSENEKYIAVATTDTVVNVLEIRDSSTDAISNFKLESTANCVEFFGNDTLVSAFGINSGYTGVGLYKYKLRWTSLSGKIIGEFSQDLQKPLCLKYNSFERKLYVGMSHGMVYIMSGAEKWEESEAFLLGYSGIDNIAFNSDGSLAAFSCWDKSIKIVDFSKYFKDGDLIGGAIHFKNLNSRSKILMFDSSNRLISAMSDKTIRIWETSPVKICKAICELSSRVLTQTEWSECIGEDIPYQKTCVSAAEKNQKR